MMPAFTVWVKVSKVAKTLTDLELLSVPLTFGHKTPQN